MHRILPIADWDCHTRYKHKLVLSIFMTMSWSNSSTEVCFFYVECSFGNFHWIVRSMELVKYIIPFEPLNPILKTIEISTHRTTPSPPLPNFNAATYYVDCSFAFSVQCGTNYFVLKSWNMRSEMVRMQRTHTQKQPLHHNIANTIFSRQPYNDK